MRNRHYNKHPQQQHVAATAATSPFATLRSTATATPSLGGASLVYALTPAWRGDIDATPRERATSHTLALNGVPR